MPKPKREKKLTKIENLKKTKKTATIITGHSSTGG